MSYEKSTPQYEFEKQTGLKLGGKVKGGNGKIFSLKNSNKVVKISAEFWDGDNRKKFIKLIEKLKKLNSPAIVRIYQYGELSNGYYFYVMDKLSSLGPDKWSKGDRLQNYIAGVALRASEPTSIKSFIREARLLTKRHPYGDIHGGNIMKNARGSLKFVDLESFTYV